MNEAKHKVVLLIINHFSFCQNEFQTMSFLIKILNEQIKSRILFPVNYNNWK